MKGNKQIPPNVDYNEDAFEFTNKFDPDLVNIFKEKYSAELKEKDSIS